MFRPRLTRRFLCMGKVVEERTGLGEYEDRGAAIRALGYECKRAEDRLFLQRVGIRFPSGLLLSYEGDIGESPTPPASPASRDRAASAT